jgi:N-methylhydantoinase A/oxoprolinase/acetone carboxylase beta subunit
VVTCFGVGTIVGGLVGLRVHPARPMLVCALCFLGAACQPAIIALGGSTAVIAGLELLAGIAVATGFIQWETTLGREIPARALSRVTSLDWFTTAGAMPLGFAVVAGAADALGTRAVMLGSAAVVMVLLAGCLALGDVRRLRAAPAPAG